MTPLDAAFEANHRPANVAGCDHAGGRGTAGNRLRRRQLRQRRRGRRWGGKPGNPMTLAPLPTAAGTGPVVPVFRRSVVSATNSTAVSTEPTMESGLALTGQYTFGLAPLTPDPNVKWQTWSTGDPRWRIPASAKLVDGGAYRGA